MKSLQQSINEALVVKNLNTPEELESKLTELFDKRSKLSAKESGPGGGSFSSNSVEGKKNRSIDKKFQSLTNDFSKVADKYLKVDKKAARTFLDKLQK